MPDSRYSVAAYLARAHAPMLDTLQQLLAVERGQLFIMLSAVLLASLVRGFTGFGLSALIMASLALLIPPVALIPVCFMLEAIASLMMLRGGFRTADKRVAIGLAIGSAVGVPIGLAATMSVDPAISQRIALFAILILAALQLLQVRPTFLGTRTGVYVTGLLAGIATGLASIGGMVVALYVLARQAPAAEMRGSLVLFLFLGMFTSGIYLTLSGMLDTTAVYRALVLSPMVIIGVLIGGALFKPALERYYKRICLALLIGLASAGLLKLSFT